jgi:hypothetical protein
MAVAALEVHTRSLVLDGQPLGAVGAYGKIAGVLRVAVDPAHPLHALVTDIALAPCNAQDRVESWADFYLLRPVEAARGNGRLLLDVPNRGRKVALGMLNRMGSTLPFPRTAAERRRAADPRPSIAERYPSRAAYLERVRAAAGGLVAARHLLAEDVEAVEARAAAQWDPFQAGLAEPAAPPGDGEAVA